MVTTLPTNRIQRIPIPRTPLVGRGTEIDEVIALLDQPDTPMVTLTGPGGVGKTRVALQVANVARDHFEDGVVFAPLASVRDSGGVLAAIGQALGEREIGDESLHGQITSALAGLRVLLVLDNFEQVTASAPMIADLLLDLPFLTVLVTSRVRLHLTTERVYPLAPLRLPAVGSETPIDEIASAEAIRLFVTRAQAVRPDFALADTNAGAIMDICRRLDGLPLAIELAAARSNALSPLLLRDRMNRSFLSTLTSETRDRPERQRTMDATIAWSYNLLTPDEQRFLQCISVCIGGFTLSAAEAVCDAGEGSTLDALAGAASLLDKSLLRLVEGVDDEPRYILLETIREFARDRLERSGTSDTVQRRHASWYSRLARTASVELQGASQAVWVERVNAEHDNLRAALAWSVDHDAELALRLVNALWFFWYAEGHLAEGRRWLERALAGSADATPGLRATALNNLGNIVYEMGELSRAGELYEASLALRSEIGDESGVSDALNNLGMLSTARGDLERARELLNASLALRRKIDPESSPAHTMNNLGDVAIVEGDAEAARQWNEMALSAGREQGNTRRMAHSLRNLGLARRCAGDDAGAARLFQHSLELFREVHEKPGIAAVLGDLGHVEARQGNIEQARSHYARALSLHRQVLDRRGLVISLKGVALLADATGHAERCVELLSAASTICGQLLPLQPPMDRDDVAAAMTRARNRLGDSAYEAAWITGSTLTRDKAIDVAVAELGASMSADSALSRREREVLQLIAQGASNQQVADTLYISIRTVKAHVTSIFTKLGLSSRAAAVAYAHRNELV